MIIWMHNRFPPSVGQQIPGANIIIIETTPTFIVELFDPEAKILEFDTVSDGGFSLSYIVR
jgi:hypothetical protein